LRASGRSIVIDPIAGPRTTDTPPTSGNDTVDHFNWLLRLALSLT
jgi:hypothetical protein